MSGNIKMSHGSGGLLTHRLIEDVFVPRFGTSPNGTLDDAAVLPVESGDYAFTTDSFVVKPLFFPGGDIGTLAVCGTVNDLAAKGARAEFLSASFVLEEGLAIETVERVAGSMAEAAAEAGAHIVTGDTKVVEQGSADGLFITTTGVGRIIEGVNLSGSNARPGDNVIVTGSIAEHGIAVMNARHGFGFSGALESDCAPLGEMITKALEKAPRVHVLRDPTRGGVATTLVEIAQASRVRIVLAEDQLPITLPVKNACEFLGFDPLYVANEGNMLALAPGDAAKAFLNAVRRHRFGRNAAVIGRVEDGDPGVFLNTVVGGMRPLIMLEGDPLPRIC
jgi:hydrogenase expression/formation protein HypE